jgi:hypothetical protein
LTLTSAAAEDILGVLRNLANILSIPAPSGYQIVERTSTPPSQKLGLYRTKGKDGKEGGKIHSFHFIPLACAECNDSLPFFLLPFLSVIQGYIEDDRW